MGFGRKARGPGAVDGDHQVVISGAAIEVGIGIRRAGYAGDDRSGALVAGFRRPVEIVAGGSAADSPGQGYLAIASRRGETGRSVRGAVRRRRRDPTGQHRNSLRVIDRARGPVEWTARGAPIKRTQSVDMGGINEILVPIVRGSTIIGCFRSRKERLPRSLEFAHHDRDATADVLVGQLLESRVYVAFFRRDGIASRVSGIMVSRPPEVLHIAPRRVARQLRELKRGVAMIFDHQAIGGRIRRQGIQPRSVPAALQHQPAVGVIAANAANRVDESLIVNHQRVHLSGTV